MRNMDTLTAKALRSVQRGNVLLLTGERLTRPGRQAGCHTCLLLHVFDAHSDASVGRSIGFGLCPSHSSTTRSAWDSLSHLDSRTLILHPHTQRATHAHSLNSHPHAHTAILTHWLWLPPLSLAQACPFRPTHTQIHTHTHSNIDASVAASPCPPNLSRHAPSDQLTNKYTHAHKILTHLLLCPHTHSLVQARPCRTTWLSCTACWPSCTLMCLPHQGPLRQPSTWSRERWVWLVLPAGIAIWRGGLLGVSGQVWGGEAVFNLVNTTLGGCWLWGFFFWGGRGAWFLGMWGRVGGEVALTWSRGRWVWLLLPGGIAFGFFGRGVLGMFG